MVWTEWESCEYNMPFGLLWQENDLHFASPRRLRTLNPKHVLNLACSLKRNQKKTTNEQQQQKGVTEKHDLSRYESFHSSYGNVSLRQLGSISPIKNCQNTFAFEFFQRKLFLSQFYSSFFPPTGFLIGFFCILLAFAFAALFYLGVNIVFHSLSIFPFFFFFLSLFPLLSSSLFVSISFFLFCILSNFPLGICATD